MSTKEEEITRRIELLKQKNERLMQRHKEVEEDKKSAEKSGQSFSNKSNINPQYEGSSHGQRRPDKHGGDRYQSHRAHMDDYDAKNTPEQSRTPNNRRYNRGRGRGTPHEDSNRGRGRETPQDDSYRGRGRGAPHDDSNRGRGRGTPHEDSTRGASRGRGRGRGRPHQDYEAKRLENFRLMEEEMAQGATEESEEAPSPGVSRFLDDPRRKGDLDPDQRWKSTRHKGNYGGLDFDNIKRGMRERGRGGDYREQRGRGRGLSRLQMSAEYTGRERRDQERWHAMREAADKEIMSRSKTSEGQWRREWDQKKDFDSQQYDEQGHSERYDEPRRNYRGGGRGKRGKGRRGSRSSHESGENGKSPQKQDQHEEPIPDEQTETPVPELDNKDTKESDDTSTQNTKNEEENINDQKSPDSRPQRQRKTKKKSPRHLAQQRAQTPSSKDGTEVWAQNSHHSDETGQEWKNGANRSAEQWLPSDEGNRNPAIDERKLEQQEDGATVYSRHLGRGWGTEKNIKATKAWVIDTEKAGATEVLPDSTEKSNSRGRNENKSNSPRKGRKYNKEDSRLKEIANERSEMRSASPRLRRGHPELTVQINEHGGRRVKRYSEGDQAHSRSEKIEIEKDEDKDANKETDESQNSIKSPLSAGALKTPEGMEYVADWATEMDLQSPTYAARQENLEKTQVSELPKNLKSGCESMKDSVQPPADHPEDIKEVASEVVQDLTSRIVQEEESDNKDTNMDINKSDDKNVVDQSSEKMQSTNLDSTPSTLDNESANDTIPNENVVDKTNADEINTSAKESADGNFKDAEEEVEDEFYECDENEQKELPIDDEAKKTEQSGTVKETANVEDSSETTAETEPEATPNAVPTTTSEDVSSVVEETVQQKTMTLEDDDKKEEAS